MGGAMNKTKATEANRPVAIILNNLRNPIHIISPLFRL